MKKQTFFTEDEFLHNVPINQSSICVLCKGGYLEGEKLLQNSGHNTIDIIETYEHILSQNCFIDPKKIWASLYSINMKGNIKAENPTPTFIHYYCALYSPRAYLEGKWYNLKSEISRSRQAMCSICKLSGATLGCFKSNCNINVHIPCALQSGWKPGRISIDNKFFCNEHESIMNRVIKLQEEMSISDISNGRDKKIISSFNDYDDLCYPNGFEYIIKNYDSEHVVSNQYNFNQRPCCSCVDGCTDISKCECLTSNKNGSNYSNNRLSSRNIEDTFKIVECNKNCNCNIKTCKNRVSENGLTYKLEIFRRSNKKGVKTYQTYNNTPSSRSVLGWGVKTLEDIPKGAFICELTGQYMLGKSIAKHKPRKGNTISNESVVNAYIDSDQRIIPVKLWERWQTPSMPSIIEWTEELLDEQFHSNKDVEKKYIEKVNNNIVIVGKEFCDDFNYENDVNNYHDNDDNKISSSGRKRIRTSNDINNIIHNIVPSVTTSLRKIEIDLLSEQLYIDTRHFGNVARFIQQRESFNEPQTIVRKLVYKSHDDIYPRLCIFASTKILKNTELLF